MTIDPPLRLVPALRFPDFRNTPGWARTTLSSALAEHGLRSDGRSEVHSVSLAKGIVPQVEHLGRSYAASDTAHYSLVRPGDVVYTRSPLSLFPLGIVKQHKGTCNAIVSPLYGVFAPRNRHLGLLVEAYLDSPSRSIQFLDPLAQKGAKNTIQLSNARFLSGSLYLPAAETEQRSIADCLRSLDDLIAAEHSGLDALRRHKRGLVQQLFPRPGEAAPRLRFQQFQGADWNSVPLGELGTFMRGLTFSASDVSDKGLLIVRSSNIQESRLVLDADLAFVDKACPPDLILQRGDVAICMSNGSKALVGKSAEYRGGYSGPLTVGAFCSIFRPSLPFARLAFVTPQYDAYVAIGLAGGSINNLKNSDLEALEWAVPQEPAEQAAIDACLTALDELIDAQRRRCESLRSHRMGLLQQIFPLQQEEGA